MSRRAFYVNDDELSVIGLALWTYLDALEGDYDDDSVTMEKLLQRVAAKRRQIRQAQEATA